MKLRDFLFLLGRPLSPLYAGVMALRSCLYQKGVLPCEELPVPVICIGNLSMGGSGKTPLVMSVVRFLQAQGRRPALLSRGYGGLAAEEVNVVADGRSILLDAVRAGDEPRLLAESLPGVPVLTGRSRTLTGRQAVQRYAVDTLVLDDGFQHLGLARNLDLVLFSAHGPLQNSRVFPGGDLRESFAALRRAQAVVITGVDALNLGQVEAFQAFLRKRYPHLEVFLSRYRAVGLHLEPGRETRTLEKLQDERLCGFCGLATPESFQQTLAAEGCRLSGFRAYRDHYPYGEADLKGLVHWARQQGATGLITTEKDFVKLARFCGGMDFPLFVLRIELSLEPEFPIFLMKQITAKADRNRVEPENPGRGS